MSAAYLSQVENDQANPTLSSLRKIAQALGTSLFYLMAPEEIGRSDCVFIPKDERFTYTPTGSKPVVELLTRSYPQPKMEASHMCLDPGMYSCDEPLGHGTWDAEEWAYILEGDLVFEIGSDEYSLSKGDAIHFRSALPHRWHNASNAKAHFLFVMCPPTF